MTEITATTPQRDLMPDLIRAWALIGIVLVNVTLFAAGMSEDGGKTPSAPDEAAEWLVSTLFTMKSYSLFSIMFGAGLGYQIASAERRAIGVAGSYYRRMAGLLFLGLLHVIFLFIGDILVTYSILGSLLFLCRNWKPKTLFIWGGIFIAIQTLLLLIGSLGMLITENIQDPEMRAQMAEGMKAQKASMLETEAIMRDGSFLDVASARLKLLPGMLPNVIFIQGVAAFGYFLIGLGFFKTKLTSTPDAKFWKLSRRVLLPLGLIANGIAGYIALQAPSQMSATAMFGYTLMMASSPLSTFGYAGLIAKVCAGANGPVRSFLARGGSASLSAYLTQSIILSFVFLEYGFGLFQELGAFEYTLIALATGIFSIVFASLWLTKFKRGPFEILLRRWTYLGFKPVQSVSG